MTISSNKPYLVLLILTLVVLGIYLYRTRYDGFETMDSSIPIINLPRGDIHLITDNNPELVTTPILNYKLQVMSKDSDAKMDVYITVFMHSSFEYNNRRYLPLGQYIKVTDKPLDIADINSSMMKDILSRKCINHLCSNMYEPIDYKLIWTSDINSDGQIFSAWHPIAPNDTVALGDVIIAGTSKPPLEYITCLPTDMLEPNNVSNGIIWRAQNDLGTQCYCWGAGNFDTYKITNQYHGDMLELGTIYNIDARVLSDFTVDSKNVKSTTSTMITNVII